MRRHRSTSSTNSSNGVSSSSTDGNSSTSTGGDPSSDTPKLEFAQGTVLRMATGYNSKNTGLFFDADYVADKGENGAITLANGKSYSAGDLKPTWVAVQEKLGMVFENQYQGNSAAKEWEFWKERLSEVDMVSGTASNLRRRSGSKSCSVP